MKIHTFALLLCGSLWADEPARSGPSPVSKVADFAAWQITFVYADPKAKASAPPQSAASDSSAQIQSRPRQVTLTRTAPYWRIETRDEAGRTVEQWFDGSEEYLMGTGLEAPVLNTVSRLQILEEGTRPDGLIDFSQAEFPDTAWVTPETYAGKEEVDGKPCLVFQKSGMKLWVDEATRNPVKWQRGEELRVFHQLTPPTSRLVLPGGIAKIAESLKKDREALRRRPPRGG